MKNPLKHKLSLANDILDSDFAFEADLVLLDEIKGKTVTESERKLADVVHRLYHLIHPMFCKAHPDWENEYESS